MKKKLVNKEKKGTRELPPHRWEAHPRADRGEANRTLIISLIAIISVMAVLLLLFVGSKVVGKAAYVVGGNSVDMKLEGNILRIVVN